MEEIKRMQDNLELIRKAAGWSAQTLGDKIGVTRGAISNLETGRIEMSKTQYIAIRAMLDAEISQHPEDTEMLATLLEVLVDHPEEYSEESRSKMKSESSMIVSSIQSGSATRKEVSDKFSEDITVERKALDNGAKMITLGASALVAPAFVTPALIAASVGASKRISSWLLKAASDTSSKRTRKKKTA